MGACLSVICCNVLITEDILSWTFVLMRNIKSTVSKFSMNFSFLKVAKSLYNFCWLDEGRLEVKVQKHGRWYEISARQIPDLIVFQGTLV